MTRLLYQGVLLLYPEPFRKEFGAEMLATFDECCQVQSASQLLTDVFLAAMRQQLTYWSLQAPQCDALYSEVGAGPRLARAMATMAVVSGVFAAMFVHGSGSLVRPVPRLLSIQSRILYVGYSDLSLRVTRSKGS